VAQSSLKTRTEVSPALPIEDLREDELTFDDLKSVTLVRSQLLWKNRRFLAQAMFAGLCVGLVVALLIPSRYESTVQLMPPDSQSGGLAMLAALTAKAGGGASGGLGAVAGDLLGVKSSGALFVGILKSRTVEDRLIDRFQLKKVYSVKHTEDARKKLSENTAASEDRKTGIVTVTVTDHDPKRAAAIAQAHIEELNQLSAQLSTSAAHRERVFLEERLTAVKRDLDDASKKFSQFASKNVALDIKEQGRAMVEAAAAIQGEMIAAESELKGLEQIYTSSNVRVRAIQARISELQRQLQKLGGKATSETDPPAASSDALYPSIRELPILGVTWADLYRRTKIQETVFEILTQQFELAKVQEAKETPSVKVLDAAVVPEEKSFPPRVLITVLGGLVLFCAAAMWVFARERWNETDASDPGKMFAREVIGSVHPFMPWTSPFARKRQKPKSADRT
jgi:uncharacterized protein involved in exopolysaccharide biosynthesis